MYEVSPCRTRSFASSARIAGSKQLGGTRRRTAENGIPMGFVVQMKDLQSGVFCQCPNLWTGKWSNESRSWQEPTLRPSKIGSVADKDRPTRQLAKLPKGRDTVL